MTAERREARAEGGCFYNYTKRLLLDKTVFQSDIRRTGGDCVRQQSFDHFDQLEGFWEICVSNMIQYRVNISSWKQKY